MFQKDYVTDYFKEYEKIPKPLPRELDVPLDSNFVISIIGPRRAGKTYFLFSILQNTKNPVYLNFEDSRLESVESKEIRDIIRIFIEIYGKEPTHIFMDEIQNVAGWEKLVRELHDLRKYKIFVTGSSAKLLSKEIATQLRGRSLSFILLPLSFREFLVFNRITARKHMSKDNEAKMKNLLREYLEFGGFPDVVKNEEKIKILKEYSDLILFRDFIERHKIRNLDLARTLHSFMIQNFSKEISIRSLFNKLKTLTPTGKDTVYEYATKLEDTMFFFFLRKFSRKAHMRESWPKKIYICDTGLTKIIKYSPDYGRLMENAVFLELLRKTNKNPLIEVFYWKGMNDEEVDFVVKEGEDIKKIIQVTYASSQDDIKEREIGSMLKASMELECETLSCITWDYEGKKRYDNKTVVFIPLWKWLLYTK